MRYPKGILYIRINYPRFCFPSPTHLLDKFIQDVAANTRVQRMQAQQFKMLQICHYTAPFKNMNPACYYKILFTTTKLNTTELSSCLFYKVPDYFHKCLMFLFTKFQSKKSGVLKNGDSSSGTLGSL